MKPIRIRRFEFSNISSLYIYSIIVGVLAGLAAMVFSFLLHRAEDALSMFHEGFNENTLTLSDKITFVLQHPFPSAVIILLPALGGLAAGLIAYFFCRDAVGTGTDEMIHAFHHREGNISSKVPFFKSIATIFTLSTGGSGGKEGPIAQVGGGVGVIVANSVKAGPRARRTLLLAGTAAGLGAIFKAPLGGALTAAEMVYKEDIESDALLPCFLSSVTAYLIYTFYTGTGTLIGVSGLHSLHLSELPFYIILGILCLVFGFLFLKGFNDSRQFISKIKIHPIIKPAIGGLLVGCLTLFFYEVSGTGSDYLESIISGRMPNFFSDLNDLFPILLSFFVIAFLKIVATTLTIGSGGSAGIFGPSLFIGGMLGAGTGLLAKMLLGLPDLEIVSYIVVGMGAFYSGVANAPLAGIIMICEMTGSYSLLPQLILASIFTFVLTKRISLYKNQVLNRFKSPAHAWDMKINLMENVSISNQFKTFRNLATVNHSMELGELRKTAARIHASDFCVIDEEMNYQGMISLRTLDPEILDSTHDDMRISLLLDKSVPALDLNEKLEKAMEVIMDFDVDKVAITGNGKVLGYLRSRDIFNLYRDRKAV